METVRNMYGLANAEQGFSLFFSAIIFNGSS
jgi:hypothetical protein